MGVNLRYFCVILWWFLWKFIINFEKWQSDVSWTDASENSRSLSNESVNIGGSCHKLVKVHLTKLWFKVCTGKNSIIIYYFKYFPFGRFWHHFLRSNCILSCIARYIVTWYIKMWYISYCDILMRIIYVYHTTTY